jgi:hypothetical protein
VYLVLQWVTLAPGPCALPRGALGTPGLLQRAFNVAANRYRAHWGDALSGRRTFVARRSTFCRPSTLPRIPARRTTVVEGVAFRRCGDSRGGWAWLRQQRCARSHLPEPTKAYGDVHTIPTAQRTLGMANTSSVSVASLNVDGWYWWKSIFGGPEHSREPPLLYIEHGPSPCSSGLSACAATTGTREGVTRPRGSRPPSSSPNHHHDGGRGTRALHHHHPIIITMAAGALALSVYRPVVRAFCSASVIT